MKFTATIFRTDIYHLTTKSSDSMKFALTLETSIGVDKKVQIIHHLSNEMEAIFSNKHYGNDLVEILIHIICVAPEFDWFSKIRKPRFTTSRNYVKDGMVINIDRLFAYDLKLDFDLFRQQNDTENTHYLAKELISSLNNFDALPKKVKDFDKDRFKADMEHFFQTQELLD